MTNRRHSRIASLDEMVQRLPAPGTGQYPVRGNAIETTPLVDVVFLFNIGAAYDPPGKKGLAALTAAMITDARFEKTLIAEINDAMYPMASGFSAG